MKKALLDRVIGAREHNRESALVTNLATGTQEIYSRNDLSANLPFSSYVEDAFRRDRSVLAQIDGEQVFIHIFSKSARLMIVGAVHIAKPLIELGRLCDYAVTLIDPRLAFASEQRFPDVRCVHQWPDVALSELDPDHRSAVVTLTHDPKIDEPALLSALQTEAFYIGALGSRRTHDSRCKRLRSAGVSERQLSRIRGPVGLDIGAESPAEIAVAIMAEITEAMHRKEEI